MPELIAAQVYDAAGQLIGGGVQLSDEGLIENILPSQEESATHYLIPGLVDAHCHGGGGCSFPDDISAEQIDQAARTHLLGGTTYLVASLVSMKDPLPAIKALVEACERGVLVGIHLEGPYISPHKAGAQNPGAIRPADLAELRTWLEAGKGWIKTMTMAPETENAVAAAELLVEYGAIPSWGHTSADGATTGAVLAEFESRVAGKGRPIYQTATHLFNAMPPLGHRAPGPVREFLAAARRGALVVELIGDGVHLDPKLVCDLLDILDDPQAPGACLITDAMAGAGMPDGAYQLGGLAVTISGGVARLTEGGNIAGGTAKLGDELAILASNGASLPQLIRAACLSPNRALNLGIDFKMRAGEKLTGVLLDEQLRVVQVYRDGQVLR